MDKETDRIDKASDSAAASTALAACMVSRVCHDLLNPVGAFVNGLELMNSERDPEQRKSYLALLEQSAAVSVGKLKFFRLAFGAAQSIGEVLACAEVQSTIAALIPEERDLTIDWRIAEEQLPMSVAKILLNLASILVDAMVRGGEIVVNGESHNGKYEIVFSVTAERFLIDKNVEDILAHGVAGNAPTTRTIPAILAQHLVAQHAGEISYSRESPTLTLLGFTTN